MRTIAKTMAIMSKIEVPIISTITGKQIQAASQSESQII